MKIINNSIALRILWTIVGIWIVFSLMISFAVLDLKLCHKEYPLGQIFHTKLFCEIKKDTNNDY